MQGVCNSSAVPSGGTKSGQRETRRARSPVALLTAGGAVGRSPPLLGHRQRARVQGSGEFNDVSFTIREAAGKSLRLMWSQRGGNREAAESSEARRRPRSPGGVEIHK